MLNYATHPVTYLKQFNLEPMPLPEDAAVMREILNHLQNGVRFELPENGSLFGDDFSKGFDVIDTTLLHLPFPVTILEYPFTIFNRQDDPEKHAVPKRVALCLD